MGILTGLFLFLAAAMAAEAAWTPCEAPPPSAGVPANATALALLVTVTRHGARTPLTVMPHEDVTWSCALQDCDSVCDAAGGSGLFVQKYIHPDSPLQSLAATLPGDCTTGQLTLAGGNQCLQLGKSLRSQYVDRLGVQLDVSRLVVRSTDVVRTRQSAMALIEGMYPPATRPAGSRITMLTSLSSIETINPNAGLCPRISQIAADFPKDPEWVSRWQALQPTLKRMNAIAGTSGSTWESSVGTWFDVLVARQCNGLAFPCNAKNRSQCITQQDAEEIYAFSNWTIAFSCTKSAEYGKLESALFFQDIMAYLAAAVAGTGTVRHAHFSAHDSSLLALLQGLQVPQPFPPLASHLEFELWKAPSIEGGFGMRTFYNGSPIAPPECPTGGKLCPWKTFAQMVSDRLTFHDFSKECAIH